jgi:predicted O-methyltransferase YrrM
MAQGRTPITAPVDAWLDRLNAPPDAVTAILRRHAGHPRAQMMTHSDVGRLLAVLVRVTGGRRVLEIGTFVGVSAAWMATSLPPGGMLDTLEIDDQTADVAERNLAGAGLSGRVRVHRGPAFATLSRFPDGVYDLAYIDADKPGYPDYLEQCIRLVRPGGVIVADNLFLGGRAAAPDADEEGARAMRVAADGAAADPRLATAALGIGDGLLVATVLGEARGAHVIAGGP